MFQPACPVVEFLESKLPVLLLTYNNEITIGNLSLLKSIADYCEWISCEWQMPRDDLYPRLPAMTAVQNRTHPYPSFKHIHYLAMYHTPCVNFLEIQVGKYTLQGTNISPQKWHFEDDFPFPQVGYVNPLEGIQVSYMFLYHALFYQNATPAAPQSSPQVLNQAARGWWSNSSFLRALQTFKKNGTEG